MCGNIFSFVIFISNIFREVAPNVSKRSGLADDVATTSGVPVAATSDVSVAATSSVPVAVQLQESTSETSGTWKRVCSHTPV